MYQIEYLHFTFSIINAKNQKNYSTSSKVELESGKFDTFTIHLLQLDFEEKFRFSNFVKEGVSLSI